MRILVLGAPLAGLLTALQAQRQGHEVCVLVHGPETAHHASPPWVLQDPGPWGRAQGALATLGGLLKDQGELRLGPEGLLHLGWLLRCLGQRSGSRARSQTLRTLALARRSQQALERLLGGSGPLHAPPQPITLLQVHSSAAAARRHQQRGPAWHLGEPPTLSSLSLERQRWPQLAAMDNADKAVLASQGVMLADTGAWQAALRRHLMDEGVRFIYDHHIEGVEHAGQHLNGVTLRSTLNLTQEIDCDWAVATSLPAAQALFKAAGMTLKLAPLQRLSLRVRVAQALPSPLLIHDLTRGVRLLGQGHELWAQGPSWLGEPEGAQAQELAHLKAALNHYVGPAWTAASSLPLVEHSEVAPAGLPLVGRSRLRNLLLNLGYHSATAHWAFGNTAALHSLMNQRRPLGRTPPPWHSSALPLAASARGSS
ncbi:MAG: hypothetical protein C4K60_09485 [Ideonella sp. MAG2]|nr:MAG: hypothetical protein C4K60_09485 [Ideonella sp. MAG2]